MERSATTFIRWIPRGVTHMLSLSLREDEAKKLAKEIQEARETQKGLLDESSGPFSDDDSSNLSDSKVSTQLLQDLSSKQSNLSKKENLTFSGQQFFGTLEADMPFILQKDTYLDQGNKQDSEDQAEEDAEIIRDTDFVLLAASADETISSIEVYVYDEENSALYVHHDFLIPNPALTIEWLDLYRNHPGNYCAIGYYGSPHLDLWDINDPNQGEPIYTLQNPNSGRNSLEQTQEFCAVSILCLHKNHHITGLLASGASDNTVQLWDLIKLTCTATYNYHTDKVQDIKWHPLDPPILLTASYDKTARIIDVRDSSCSVKGCLTADAESLCWNRHSPFHFWVSTEDGFITEYDIRKMSKDISSPSTWCIQGHSKSCSSITDCPVSGLLTSCGVDGLAKIWSISDCAQPTLIYERNLKAGPLYSVSPANETSTLFSFAGNVVVIWDITDTNVINRSFNLPTVDTFPKE